MWFLLVPGIPERKFLRAPFKLPGSMPEPGLYDTYPINPRPKTIFRTF